MLVAIVLISIALELLLFQVPFFWAKRRILAGVPLALTAFSASAITITQLKLLVLPFVIVSAFRLLNHLRIAEGRMHEKYLRRVALRTSLLLAVFQLVSLVLVYRAQINTDYAVSILIPVQVVFAGGVFLTVLYNIKKTKHRPVLGNFSDKELPTVTVAIPARNATVDLEDCLRSVLANNYPKFEVLVLDDSSQDNTPEIIKSFAHDGVRFIKGAEPHERWLSKNQAYDRLADEATGELILFCGVDVRFGPETIRALVTTLLKKDKDMISIMPRRLTGGAVFAFIQPMRYWWELAFPRRFLNRPAVLSTCWLIRRKQLKKLGGFEAVSHTILPEGYFARELVKSNKYSMLRADDTLDIQTRKGVSEQRDTAIRMRYPQLRRRPELVMLLSFGEVVLLLGPFAVLVSTFWAGFHFEQLLGGLACILLILTHLSIVQVTNPANVLVALINFPIVVLTELVLGYTSMIKYEFSTVEWKGRVIHKPIMHVIPKLPEVEKP
jgi:hypothetical protein